ncbi:MAG: hypothetical protein RLZZ230_798 [Candidatus Parcubacteria bacterium]
MTTLVNASPVNQSAALITFVTNAEPVIEPIVIEAPTVTAKAYGVFDMETGELLLSQDANESLPIASVTKLFTAAELLREEDSLDETVTITDNDVATEGRSGKLEIGQTYKAHELLFPLLLESSNDAATALARTIAPIPLAGEILSDGSGLSSQNKASVSQLATEVKNLYISMPHLFDITTLSQHVGEYTGWVNNSPVKDMVGYKGGKHGYTEAAGRTLVAIFAEPSLDNQEFGYILLGSDDIKADTLALRAAVANSVHSK